jgi:hypothetical protein
VTTNTIEPKRGRAAFYARPAAKTLPRVQPHAKHGEKRTRWTYEDWIAKARAAIKRYRPRHLADLLAALQLSFGTSKCWAVGAPARTCRGKPIKAVKPKPGWLKATSRVPMPWNHDLHMLRYLNHPTLDAITARRAALESEGVGEIKALRQAVDEIVGEARKAGEERRRLRRIEKYGHDPVPEHRLTREERAERQAKVKEAQREFLDRTPRKRVKKANGRIGKTARQKRKARALIRSAGGRKALAVAMLEAKRKARWQRAAAELYGVKSFARVPVKPMSERDDPGVTARIEKAIAQPTPEPVVKVIDYSQQ